MPPSNSITYGQRNKRRWEPTDSGVENGDHDELDLLPSPNTPKSLPLKKRKVSPPAQAQLSLPPPPPPLVARTKSTGPVGDKDSSSKVPPRTLSSKPDSSSSLISSTPSKKITKRMLGRSRTEPSLGSTLSATSLLSSKNAAITSFGDRTSSLPTILSPSASPPKRVPSSSQPHVVLSSGSTLQRTASMSASASTSAVAAAASRSKVTRTYGGKSRSILVELPLAATSASVAAASAGLSPSQVESQSQTAFLDEDEFHTRESYASLRSRWGVDNSEDDPYPPPVRGKPTPSPSISRQGSTSVTPSPSKRSSKGKAKEQSSVSTPVMEHLPNGMMNPLKSITELRSKGSSRRFFDEVGYLLEGLAKGSTTGLRRSTLLEINEKLCDADFLRKAKAADFVGQVWAEMDEADCLNEEDKVLNTLVVLFVALLTRDNPTLADLCLRAPVADKLIHFLANPDPLPPLSSDKVTRTLEFKKLGYAKIDHTVLHGLIATVAHSGIKELSPQEIARTTVSGHMLAAYALSRMPAASLPVECAPELIRAIKLRLDSSEASEGRGVGVLNNILHLLDWFLLGQWGASTSSNVPNDVDVPVQDLIPGLVNLCASSIPEASEERGQGDCLDLAFRALISMTNSIDDGAMFCSNLIGVLGANKGVQMTGILRSLELADSSCRGTGATTGHHAGGNRALNKEEEDDEIRTETDDTLDEAPETKDPVEDAAAHALDRLCLILGLLTNLVHSGDTKVPSLFVSPLYPTCDHAFSPKQKSQGSCDESCERQKISAAEVLAQLYATRLSASPSSPVKLEDSSSTLMEAETAAQANADAFVVLGHLAILLGLIMRMRPTSFPNDVDVQELILDTIPGAGGSRGKLERMVQQARELGQFYEAITTPADQDQSEDGEDAGVTGPRSGRSRGGGDTVTRDVLRTLEELRDGR